jgi:uncharacterized protein (UPF0335 family)
MAAASTSAKKHTPTKIERLEQEIASLRASARDIIALTEQSVLVGSGGPLEAYRIVISRIATIAYRMERGGHHESTRA